ncbi:acyl-CoA dehydrogenase, partial [Oleiphilus sp. HI0080]
GYQVSLAFAKDRLQSRSLAGPKNPDGPADSILVHPDVRRMILKQKVLIEGGRAMAYWSAYQQDLAHAAADEAEREKADDLFQIMTPIVKSFLTDEGYFSCDSALQSMGGNGFTQDWPVEQLLRDGRIARIYEGTNGIQALDLIGRKLTMRGGRLPRTYLAAMNELLQGASAEHKKLAEQFIAKLTKTLMGLAKTLMADLEEAGAAATPLLRMFALTSLAVFWARMAEQADDEGTKGRYSADYLSGKKKAADHFFRLYLPEMDALAADIEAGKATLMDFAEAEF